FPAFLVLLERQKPALSQDAGVAARQFAAAADLAYLAEDFFHDVEGRKAHIDRRSGARGNGVDGGAALPEPDIDSRAEIVVGQPVQALDFARKRLDRADPLRVRGTRMRRDPRDLELNERRALAPRHEIAARPPGLGIENGSSVLGFRLDDGARGGGTHLLVRGVEAGQPAWRAKAAERFEHKAVHDEARFHIGDTRSGRLVAVAAKRALSRG